MGRKKSKKKNKRDATPWAIPGPNHVTIIFIFNVMLSTVQCFEYRPLYFFLLLFVSILKKKSPSSPSCCCHTVTSGHVATYCRRDDNTSLLPRASVVDDWWMVGGSRWLQSSRTLLITSKIFPRYVMFAGYHLTDVFWSLLHFSTDIVQSKFSLAEVITYAVDHVRDIPEMCNICWLTCSGVLESAAFFNWYRPIQIVAGWSHLVCCRLCPKYSRDV